MSWTKEDQAQLRTYQTAQMTVKEIARKMQKPQEWIRSELEAMGYKPIEDKPKGESDILKGKKPVKVPKRTYRRITPETEKQICELREKCFSISQIAEKLNIATEQSVVNALKRNGYPTGRGQYHKLTAADVTVQEQTPDKPKPAKINEEFDRAVNEMIAEAREEKAMTVTEKEPAPSANDASSKQDITPVIPVINDSTEPQKSQAPALTGIKMMMEIEAMLGEVFGRDAGVVSVNADGDHCDIGFAYQGREYSLLFAQREEVPDYGNDKH